jgi:uncharacterized protein involved in exopolysaccharide biosynthesis
MDLETFEIRRTLAEFTEAIRRRWLMVLAVTAMCVGAMGAFIYYFPPVYKSGFKVLIQDEHNEMLAQFYNRWNIFRPVRKIETEADLMRVGPVAEAVVDRLGLTYDDVYHPFLRQVIDLWGKSFVGRNYRALKKKVFPPATGPFALSEEEIDRLKTIDDFKRGIEVETEGSSSVARVTVLGPTPRVAEMANAVAEEYLKQRDQRRQEEAMAAYRALEPQVEQARRELTEAELALQTFLDEQGVKFEFDKEKNEILSWTALESALTETRGRIQEEEKRLQEIERQLAREPKQETASQEQTLNENKRRMQAQLLEYQIKLAEESNRFTPDSPEIQEIRANIAALEAKIRETDDFLLSSRVDTPNPVYHDLRLERSRVQVSLAQLRALAQAQQKAVDDFEARLKDLPEKQRRLAELSRDVKLKEERYTELEAKKNQAYISGVADVQKSDTVSIVEKAVVPDKPSRPITKLYLLASLVGGLAMGCCAAFVAGFFDDTVRPSDDLEALTGAPWLGRIPLGAGNGASRR